MWDQRGDRASRFIMGKGNGQGKGHGLNKV
jgi:hypothetical protein